MTFEEFVSKALFVKFTPKGRDYSGWDCYGLGYCCFRDVRGILLPSFTDDYPDAGDTKASRRVIHDIILSQKYHWEVGNKPRAMDIVLFRFGDTETHLGLMRDSNWFLHCEKKINTVSERVNSAKWEKRVEGFYRLKDKNAG